MAACEDSEGVPFRLWEAGGRLGAQVTNAPSAWNFSDLHAADPARSAAFYADVFGWQIDDVGFGAMIRQPDPQGAAFTVSEFALTPPA